MEKPLNGWYAKFDKRIHKDSNQLGDDGLRSPWEVFQKFKAIRQAIYFKNGKEILVVERKFKS